MCKYHSVPHPPSRRSNSYIISPLPLCSPLSSLLLSIFHLYAVSQTSHNHVSPWRRSNRPHAPSMAAHLPRRQGRPSASIPRSYLDRTDLSDVLFNPERAWGAYSKLAIPAPLPTKDGRVVLPTRRAAPKLSRLETLPVELLSMIVGESGLEKSDVVALSLSSTML
jgi:hypothetical protein